MAAPKNLPNGTIFDSIIRRCMGSFALMTNRPEGLRALDLTPDGTRWSFIAFVLAMPIELYRVSTDQNILGHTMGPGLLAADMFLIAALWLGPLGVLYLLARPLGFAERFPTYVNASNWGKLAIAYLLLPITILQALSPANTLALIALFVAFFASLAAAFFLTRITLEKPSQFAFGIVVLEFLVTIVLFATFTPTG
ncbi:MAG: hypothetical protein AAGH82_02360 [Pseudomonadota bacterium]